MDVPICLYATVHKKVASQLETDYMAGLNCACYSYKVKWKSVGYFLAEVMYLKDKIQKYKTSFHFSFMKKSNKDTCEQAVTQSEI